MKIKKKLLDKESQLKNGVIILSMKLKEGIFLVHDNNVMVIVPDMIG